MPTRILIDDFLELAQQHPLLDVRSPGEYAKGHVLGARNLPLFDDLERAEIGTIYNVDGRQPAFLHALEIVGPKMRSMAESVLSLFPPSKDERADGGNRQSQKVLVYCWRGGMRSGSVAWLFEQAGLEIFVLSGGYKSYRQRVVESFDQARPFMVLSGLTGAGKTEQIKKLKTLGQQAIDLEGLANHRGSAFGSIGLGAQPTVEQFENRLFTELEKCDPSLRIWVEDESRKIGEVVLPPEFYEQLKKSPAIFMDVSREARSRVIVEEYGKLDTAEIVASIRKITKRMGGQNVKSAIEYLESNDMLACVDVLLEYYDRTYLVSKARIDRDVFHHIPIRDPMSGETTDRIVSTADSLGLLNV